MRVAPALVHPADLEVLRVLGRVGEVLLGPVDSARELPVAGQRHVAPPGEPLAPRDLAPERAVGIGERRGQLAAGGRQALVGSRDRHPQRPGPPGRHPQLVAKLAALPAPERAVVALARRLLRGADVVALVAAVGRAGHARRRRAVRGHERRPVVRLRVRVRQLALLAEHERPAVEGGGVGEVVARVRLRAVEAPWIRAEQLRVGVDLHPDRTRRGAGIPDVQPEQRRAPAVGREVGAAQRQAGGARQAHLAVAPAAPEPGRGADPLVVHAEPDAVDELQRRRPHAAHLAGDVPAVGVEAPVLEADGVRPLRRDEVAPVLEAVGDRELRRRHRGRRGGREEHEDGDQGLTQHRLAVLPGPGSA